MTTPHYAAHHRRVADRSELTLQFCRVNIDFSNTGNFIEDRIDDHGNRCVETGGAMRHGDPLKSEITIDQRRKPIADDDRQRNRHQRDSACPSHRRRARPADIDDAETDPKVGAHRLSRRCQVIEHESDDEPDPDESDANRDAVLDCSTERRTEQDRDDEDHQRQHHRCAQINEVLNDAQNHIHKVPLLP